MFRQVFLPAALAVAVVTVFLAPSSHPLAEWPGFPAAAPGQAPVDVVKAGGKVVWKVRGSGTVKLYDVLTMYADSFDRKSVYYDRNQLPNRDCAFSAPNAGNEYSGDEIAVFVSNMLREHQLAITEYSPGHEAVVAATDAMASGRIVDEKELASAGAADFVIYAVRLANTDANSVASAMRGMMRPPSSVMPLPGAVLIGGRAGDVRGYVKAVAMFDKPRGDELTLKRHELAEGMDAEAILVAIRRIMPPATPGAPVPPTATNATFAEVKRGILVRGNANDHKLVDEIISQYNGK